MTSTYQNIINENNKPPGYIYNDNYWVFPKIKKKITRSNIDKTNEWIIFVELYENKKNIKILDEYFNNLTLQDVKYEGVYYTISGDTGGKKTQSEKTFISSGKNIGKKNQTNVFTQVLMDARSKYNKKLNESNKCINLNIDDDTKDDDDNHVQSSKKKTQMQIYAPMLLHVYEDKRINFNTDVYYIQKKSDGLRAIYNNGIMWSRQKKLFPKKDYLIDELSKMLTDRYFVNGNEIDNDKLYIDGELYKHGLKLEEINSIARSNINKDKHTLEFHIFDVFYPSIKMTYNDRLVLVNTMFQTNKHSKYIKLVETHPVYNQNDIKKLYKYYVDNNDYEGLVIRAGLGLYNLTGGRSYDVLKIKKRMDEDMVLISYTSGKAGKEKDAIIFIVDPCIKDYKEKMDRHELKTILSGKEFNVVPNWTNKQRKDLYYKFENNPGLFHDVYFGSPIRIQFDCYSSRGIPLRAKAINLLIE